MGENTETILQFVPVNSWGFLGTTNKIIIGSKNVKLGSECDKCPSSKYRLKVIQEKKETDTNDLMKIIVAQDKHLNQIW